MSCTIEDVVYVIDGIRYYNDSCYDGMFTSFDHGRFDMFFNDDGTDTPWQIGHGRTINNGFIEGKMEDHTLDDVDGFYAFVDFTLELTKPVGVARLRSNTLELVGSLAVEFWFLHYGVEDAGGSLFLKMVIILFHVI